MKTTLNIKNVTQAITLHDVKQPVLIYMNDKNKWA